MPQSVILRTGSKKITESVFLSWIFSQIDRNEKLEYPSFLISTGQRMLNFFVYSVSKIFSKIGLSWSGINIDLKSGVIFIFIVALIAFPGYGSNDTSIALLSGSPIGSLANQGGAFLNRLISYSSLIALLIMFTMDIKKRREVASFTRFEIILLLFLVSLLISTLLSTYVTISFPWLRQATRGIIAYFIFSRLNLSKNNLLAICYAFITVALIESVIAFFQFINKGFLGLPIETAASTTSSSQLFTFINDEKIFRSVGTLNQSNLLSFVLALVIPFMLILLFDKRKWIRNISVATGAICILTSFITFSRWGTITLFFSLISFGLILFTTRIHRFKIKPLFKPISIFVAALLIIFGLSSNLSYRFLSFSSNDSSLSVRLPLIDQAVYVFQHNFIFGIGGGTFAQYLVNYDFTSFHVSRILPAPVHIFLLGLLAESGLISMLLMLVLLLYFVISCFKNLKAVNSSKNKFMSLFIVALFISVMSFFFNGLWTTKSLDDSMIILLWMPLGLYFNLTRKLT